MIIFATPHAVAWFFEERKNNDYPSAEHWHDVAVLNFPEVDYRSNEYYDWILHLMADYVDGSMMDCILVAPVRPGFRLSEEDVDLLGPYGRSMPYWDISEHRGKYAIPAALRSL